MKLVQNNQIEKIVEKNQIFRLTLFTGKSIMYLLIFPMGINRIS